MNRTCILLACVAFAGAVQAQTANPLSQEVRRSYQIVRNNLIKMAEKMPEERYAFKPTPEIETFGRRVAHITDANMRTCAGLRGEQKSLGAASKTRKADLVAALKESLTYCDAVFDSMTDAAALEMANGRISSPPVEGTQSKLATLYSIVRHSNEMYGYMSVYLRLNGIVPPSSEP